MGNNIITNYPITDYKDIGVKYKAIQEVADMLGTSRQTIYRYFNNNLIKKYNFKNNIYVAIEDIKTIEEEFKFNKEKRNKYNNTTTDRTVTVRDCNSDNNVTIGQKDNISPNYEKLYSDMIQENAEQASLIYDLTVDIRKLSEELSNLKKFKPLYEVIKKEKDTLDGLVNVLTAERDKYEKELLSKIEELKFLNNESTKTSDNIKELTLKCNKLEEEKQELNQELNQLKIKNSMNDEYKNLYNTLYTDYRNLQTEKDSIKDNQIKSLEGINENLHRDIETLINTTKDTQFLLAQQQLESSKEAAITVEPEKEGFFKKIFKK